ncbi:UPF0749 protein YlxW [Alicyclobacillus hesperidum subsp. aegles]|uniref:DUF881 domain-containing protein n=1 Tax=Alicyclobacillus hesperidum TaxID=89784 RepID=UPI0007193A72|nr:DUF881 domain-containing protein [Alicyclobacillus hesperidum]KRW92419.1 hypothetical protein SD51_02565 [Alicyclobacillus tengchongensis]GLG01107.1 UPF0749 protein YlxW [Alicyclobacillus hesperidum subsp. aegles]
MNAQQRLTWSLTTVSVVLGFMIAVSYRQNHVAAALGVLDTGSSAVNRQLTQRLSELKASNQEADQTLANLTAEIAQYEQKSAGSSQSLQDLQAQLSGERILAGSTPVHGPGVVLTLNDGDSGGTDIEQILAHDWNIRNLVNELFTAGAEAVAINDYRVVATSAIQCQGPVVSVNGHRLGAPFTVSAIGDPATLTSALEIQGGILDALRQQGLQVSTPQVENDIDMPAYTNSLQPVN